MCLNIKHWITGSHPSRQRKQYVMSLFSGFRFFCSVSLSRKKVMALLGLEKCWRTAATTSLLDLLAPFSRLLKCRATQKFLSFFYAPSLLLSVFYILFSCLPTLPLFALLWSFPSSILTCCLISPLGLHLKLTLMKRNIYNLKHLWDRVV